MVGPLVLLAAAMLLRLTHHPRRAGLVGVIAVVLALTMLASRRLRRLLDRLAPRQARFVSGAMTWFLLAPVHVLVVTPLGVLLRVCGRPPLDVSRDLGRASYWSARSPDRAARPRRTFADQRGWQPVGFSPSQRRRLMVRTVTVVVLIEALVAGGVHLVERRPAEPADGGGVSVASTGPPAALRDLDWVGDAYDEQNRVVGGLVYTPYAGPSLRDFRGRYFNVANRVRASYRSPLVAGREPVEIWFFGGSTAFGFDLQRDGHTISSELVRLAEDRGIAVTVRNYGMAGYVNYQETVLLSLLVTAGEAPDLAVFYDGSNDFGLAVQNTFGGANPRGEPGDAYAITQRRGLAVSGEIRGGSAEPPAPLGLRPGRKPVSVDEVIGDAVGVYAQGVELGRTLADWYGFRIAHFWQPDIFSKDPLDPAEKDFLRRSEFSAADVRTTVAMIRRTRESLPPGIIDVSDALDHLSGPILSDNVHTNEKGARAVAEAMYAHLEPELVELSSRG
jgi:lysophospholipase L1-like esterase